MSPSTFAYRSSLGRPCGCIKLGHWRLRSCPFLSPWLTALIAGVDQHRGWLVRGEVFCRWAMSWIDGFPVLNVEMQS